MKQPAPITDETDLLPAPRAELERRLKIYELLTDLERDMLREIWLRDDHDRLFRKKRGRPFHMFD